MNRSRLENLLSLVHPIIQGPFGGGLSTVLLAATVSNAGGLGSYGAHILEPEGITKLVAELRAATSRSFSVNLWVPQPGETDRPDEAELARHIERMRPYLAELGLPEPEARYPFAPDFDQQAEALLAAAPPAISFVMGIPPKWTLDEARRQGIVTIGTATTVAEAVALEAAGVNAVVASGSDAGGHRGAFLRPVRESLVGTFALVPQVADAVSIPVIAAGGIADGRGIAAARMLGADGVQIGTGFLATEESGASPVHKEALRGPMAGTTVLTRLFSGRHARGIPNRLIRELAALEDEVPAYPITNALMQPIRRAAAERGSADHLNLWSGQAASLAKACNALDYFHRLVADTDRVISL
ncbi:MAG TPA: 2-nitropropane dioxygenase [Micromonosporaceae bacterium]|nr:2-nitropropane dioxygenase [Micromonosporaceae bacterium]HCU50383.1 2-nitropropane dioxygenase [Micromonosporaceae bacterium]